MSSIKQLEASSLPEMYEKASLMATDDGAIRIAAGSTLGGGTKVNYTMSFRTPDRVLKARFWNESRYAL